MFTKYDKAITGFLSIFIVTLAQAIVDGGEGGAIGVISDPNTWIMAATTAVMVWVFPNKGAIYR